MTCTSSPTRFNKNVLSLIIFAVASVASASEGATSATGSSTVSILRCEEVERSLPAAVAALADAIPTVVVRDESRTAFFVSPDGWLVSSAPPAGSDSMVEVVYDDQTPLMAEVVRVDADHDLALLKVAGDNYPCIAIDESRPSLGEVLFYVRASGDEGTPDIVREGVARTYLHRDERRLLQTDITLAKDDAGGPVLNAHGQAVGIVSWRIEGEYPADTALVIPQAEIEALLGIEWKIGPTIVSSDSAVPPERGTQATSSTSLTDPADISKYLPVISRPDGASRLHGPNTPTRRPVVPPILTIAAGGLLVCGSIAYTYADPNIITPEWRTATAVNSTGYLTVVVGGAWLLNTALWNRRLHTS